MNSPVLQTIKIRRLSLLRSHYLGSGRYRNLTTYYDSMTIERRHICETLSLTESPKLVISVPYELVGQGSPDQYNRPYRECDGQRRKYSTFRSYKHWVMLVTSYHHQKMSTTRCWCPTVRHQNLQHVTNIRHQHQRFTFWVHLMVKNVEKLNLLLWMNCFEVLR